VALIVASVFDNFTPASISQLFMNRLCRLYFLLGALLFCSAAPASGQVHGLSLPVDGALATLGGLTYGISIPLQKKVDPLSPEQLEGLDPLLLRRFERVSTWQDSELARLGSDIGLRASVLTPLALLGDPRSRSEFGTISVMWLETLLVNNGITRLVKASARRARPYAYNPMTGEELKVEPETRLSFFSGHTSNSAAACFFTAQTLTNNRPGMQNKGLVWASAAALPALTGLLRIKAGRHFPTDVVVGYGVGALIGIVVPNLHR
jgi:membrane-associated phospholipid phosphatase